MKNNVFILESYKIGGKKYRLIHDKNQALPYSIEKYIDGVGAKFWQQIGSWYSKKRQCNQVLITKTKQLKYTI